MPVNILMPALSPTMDKGNLAKWLKREGDKVKAGDVIAEIETDKATMEYEAIDDGVLAKIVVPEGTQDVPVNQLIAILTQDGEDPKTAVAAVTAVPAPRAAPPKAAPTMTPVLQPAPVVAATNALVAIATPHGHGNNRVFASPLARRLAKDAGLDLGRLQGSGPHGRIVARDVDTAKSGKGGKGERQRQAPDQQLRRHRTTRSGLCSSKAPMTLYHTTICARSSHGGWSKQKRRFLIST